MKRIIIILVAVATVGSVAGQDPDSVVAGMKRVLDRIETFTADALVYEYFG